MKTAGYVLLLLVATLAAPLEHIFAQTSVSLPPTGLSAQATSASQINLGWTAPVNATSNGVNGYKIERDLGCIGTFATHITNTTSTATTFSDSSLLTDFCYAYRVSALNQVGSSVPSNTASATTLYVPNAPTGLTVTALSGKALKLSWIVSSDNGGSKITGYQIQRNGTILVANTGNNQTSYTDSNLKPVHQQTYRVAAWNEIGLGSFSANATGKTTNGTSTDKGNLGQAVSDFVHKRNELLKQQRDELHKLNQECLDKIRSANATQRKQIKEDCRDLRHELKHKYQDLRKQFREDFKVFRETTKDALKDAKKAGLIDKSDIKEFKRDVKEFKRETKEQNKEFKHELKELKKEHKKDKKKDKHDDDEDD